MTPEAQRIAIAEYCDRWQFRPATGYPDQILASLDGDNFFALDIVPDYLGSLDAMHEAEEFLKLEDYHAYACYVGDLCEKYGSEAVSLKPQIRAEAFLRTVGRWVE